MNNNRKLYDFTKKIDKDHIEFYFLLERLGSVITRHETKMATIAALDVLVEFYIGHIYNEEQIMVSKNFEEFYDHYEDHNKIIYIISAIVTSCERYCEVDLVRFIESLKEVYKIHITEFDRPFFEKLRNDGMV